MSTYSFQQVDVFTDRLFGGNPLAVFPDGAGLTTEQMQAIALEMNLSETTFVFQPIDPEHAAKVRIFTPHAELPFAGHPTVGTAWVLAQAGAIPAGTTRMMLELGVGPVQVEFDDIGDPGAFIWMRQGRPEFGPIVDDRAAIASALGVQPSDLAEGLPIQFVSTGFPFLLIPLVSPEAVDRASLGSAGFGETEVDAGGAFIFSVDPVANRVYSRMIATIGGAVWEDPATGSANGPLGGYLARYGMVSGPPPVRIISEQGTRMGRQSFIHLVVEHEDRDPTGVTVGGQIVPVLTGELHIPDS